MARKSHKILDQPTTCICMYACIYVAYIQRVTLIWWFILPIFLILAKTLCYAVNRCYSLLWMGAIAFADLDILSDEELHVVVKWWLKDTLYCHLRKWVDTHLAPPVIFDLKSCKDLDFFFDLHECQEKKWLDRKYYNYIQATLDDTVLHLWTRMVRGYYAKVQFRFTMLQGLHRIVSPCPCWCSKA